MLGKILKYEFRATARIFLLMYVALLVLALYNAILLPLDGNTLNIGSGSLGRSLYEGLMATSVLLYGLAVVAVMVMTIALIVLRFYRMFGDEGYLWFTLPATANQHLLGKLISAIVWSVVSLVIVIVSVGIFAIKTQWYNYLYHISDVWNLLENLGFSPGLWLTLGIIFMIISFLSSALMFYAAIAIGPNIIKSRLGGSVLAYIVLTIISQILSTVGTVAVAEPMLRQVEILDGLTLDSSSAEAVFSGLATAAQAVDQTIIVFSVTFSAIYLIFAVALYFLSRYFMAKKLNLR